MISHQDRRRTGPAGKGPCHRRSCHSFLRFEVLASHWGKAPGAPPLFVVAASSPIHIRIGISRPPCARLSRPALSSSFRNHKRFRRRQTQFSFSSPSRTPRKQTKQPSKRAFGAVLHPVRPNALSVLFVSQTSSTIHSSLLRLSMANDGRATAGPSLAFIASAFLAFAVAMAPGPAEGGTSEEDPQPCRRGLGTPQLDLKGQWLQLGRKGEWEQRRQEKNKKS
jgi:hypothetical protein